MTEHKLLDAAADVLPVGLQPTPFGDVWQALQQVAAQVWDVDPSVYRAGIAWLWYALRNPAALASDGLRPLLVAALISEQAPLVKDTQTVAELAEYLRLWLEYTPTYPKLEALYSVFAARVEVRPISDAESQGVVPVADRRLAFYLRVEEFDAERPLTLDEVYQIAVRATPLGSRPVPYFALVGSSDVFAGPATAGLVRALWASEPAAAPPMSFVVVDSATGAIVHGFNQVLDVYELPSVVLNSEDGYETYELPSVSLPTPNVVIGVPMSGPVQAFCFTDEGRDEASDKTFTAVGNPLFDEDGSIARNELYDSAVPLSFMRHDGNMFEPDSDTDTVRYLPVTDRLVLSIPGDSTTRDKSAWSVQCAKLFVLSYANTQLPDVQIELPINEVGGYGTSITLPTIDGEYESGGKTWKPSAWDIGAFGSSYSMTADTVAHLVFTEVVQYTEITLYLQSGNKNAQTGVTSAFTGNVNSGNCYQLYIDEECTIPWTGYDYSNDYKVGRIPSSGVWTEFIDSVAEMPDYAGSGIDFKVGLILLDTGVLWLCCNLPSSSTATASTSKIVVRIYPKDQSLNYHVGYFYSSNAYGNRSGDLALWPIFTAPGTSTLMTYFGNTTIVGLYGSAGNPVSLTADDILTYYQQESTWRTFRFKPTPQRAMAIRFIVFTTPKPMEIDIDVNFGDPVTIPAGYHVESVKCQRLYVNASSVTHSIYDQYVSFVFDGENQYCALNDIALLGAGVVPCLTIFAIASDQGGGYWITYRPMSSTVNPTVSLSNKRLNSGGAFVSADALVSGATSNADTIANALNTYPALFRYYDFNNTIVPYYFRIQQSVWQFQNGVFSWLGDTTDVSDLAYWYNTRAVRVHCVKI